ncbi:MAG: choice-of-anchor M domain-containing protein [Verrucomicrobia bacterium]|nr:choice-of-anchor M domain-containing protein [Verrucomicrobiota bacterium]
MSGEPVRLTTQHVDFRVLYAPGTTNELFLMVRDGDARTNYAATNVVLVVRPPAETTLPEGFPEFGQAGSPFWILPASQNPELLYLGVSGEGLPSGVFAGSPEVQLIGVRAPGDFFAWRFDPSGSLELFMDSRNGIGPDDRIPAPVGGHGHFNWGFSSNGWFEVTFRVVGRLAGATTNLLAADTPFRFAVEPLPPEPAAATLSVLEAGSDSLACRLTGSPGVSYQIELSSDLGSWRKGTAVRGAVDPVDFTVPLPGPGQCYLYVRAVAGVD